MRTVQLSTEVFAAIWAKRKPGQENEDQILRGVFGLESAGAGSENENASAGARGYLDDQGRVVMPEGFEIFRTYKGREYRAKVTGGKLVLLSTKEVYPSLNKLSWAVVDRNENAWRSWKYLASDGTEKIIDKLRPS